MYKFLHDMCSPTPVKFLLLNSEEQMPWLHKGKVQGNFERF